MKEGLEGDKPVKSKFFNVVVQDSSTVVLKESMDQLFNLGVSQERNQEMQEDADKEISRLLEALRKAIQKTNEDSRKAI